MSSAIVFENSSSPSYVGEAPHTENQLVAMCMIYALLNQALGDGVKVQGDVGTSLSTAQDKIRDTLDNLNTKMATLKGQIQNLKDTMDSLSPYLTALSLVSLALGVGAAGVAVAGASFGLVSVQTIAGVIKMLGSLAGIASGVLGVMEGSYGVQQSNCSQELAPVNSDVSLAMAAQKNYQATSKTVVGQIGESMSSITSLAQSIAKDIRTINEGLREANQNVLQGVLGNYK